MTSVPYTDLQLDALRELANIGSGNAGTALSSLLGRAVDISVPNALALPLAEAVDSAGGLGGVEQDATAVVLPVFGDLSGVVLLLFTPADVLTLTGLLGVEPGTEVGDSALGEVGNILGSSYVNSLAAMTGLEIEPGPPQTASDMLGALVASVVLSQLDGASDTVLMLDSALQVEDENCSMSFLLVPAAGGVQVLLDRLGLGAA
jgi:chemotaxis protein CheC